MPLRWTLEEQNLLQEVRARLRHKLDDRPQFPEVVGDRKLIRFIRGHGHQLEKVCEMVENFLDWRTRNNVDHIRDQIVKNGINHWTKFPKGDLITRLIPSVIIAADALDKRGSPICIDQYNFSPSSVLEQITLEDYMLYTIYGLEYRSLILEQLSHEREEALLRERVAARSAGRFVDDSEPYGVIVQTCVIRDLGGIGFDHMGSQGQAILKPVIAVASDNYPEMMRKCYMVNCPWIFNTVWFVIKGWLADKTVEKVTVFGSTYINDLQADILLENIPKLLTGNV